MAIEKKIEVQKRKGSENINIRQRLRYLFCMSLSMFFLFLSENIVNAQDRLEVGPLVGVSYYFGDLNPSIPFVNNHLAIGGLVRYVFNDRIAVKGSAIYSGISGTYDPSNGIIPGVPDGYSFNRNIGDVAVMAEINLFSYDHKYISTTLFSPYLTLGAGTMLYNRTSEKGEAPAFVLTIPFGVGVKYKMNKWVKLGAEWSFRKLFIDDVEGNMVPGDVSTFDGNAKSHNNDWYSIVNVYVTFSFLKRHNSCVGGYKD